MNRSIYYKDDLIEPPKPVLTDEQFKVLENCNELILIRAALANYQGKELEKKLLEIVYNYA